MKRVKTLGIRLGAALVIAGAGLLGTAARASAASVIYTAQTSTAPNSNALQNMTHQNAYSWQLEGIDLQNDSITKAVLTFNGFFNWTDVAHDPYNILWVDLLDPKSHTTNGAISTFTGDDTNTGTLGINDVLDCFRYSNYPTGTDKSCAGFVPNNGSIYVGSSNNGSDSSVQGYGNPVGDTASNAGAFGQTPTTWTLTITNSVVLQALANYISTGGNIAFGLDSDCHFGDTNITFQIYGQSNGTQSAAVPEPGTMLLVGSGLFAAYRRRRRLSA